MKVIARTTGKFMLVPYDGGETPIFDPYRNTITPKSAFVDIKVAQGQLTIMAVNVSDKATQEGVDAAESVTEYLKSLEVVVPPVVEKNAKSKA